MDTKGEYEKRSLMKFGKCGVIGAVALLLLLPVVAWSGGVVTNCTETDLRAAMAGGGVVTFACDGTIFLANTITNASDTTLNGSGRQVTISGNNSVRVFYINTNLNFTVVNLTIANGTSLGGSAILNLGATVNLTGVTFRSNTATVGVSNACPVYGGAIWNEAGQVNLRSCAFVGNGAIGGDGPVSGTGNPALGGAIDNSGTVTMDLCTLTGNSANGGEGGGGSFF